MHLEPIARSFFNPVDFAPIGQGFIRTALSLLV